MTTSELAAEQAHVDRAYTRLEQMVEEARIRAAQAAAQRESAGPLRDTLVRRALERAHELAIGDEPIVFGRTDAADGTTMYIGRIGVQGEHHEPLVVDWRAPAAEVFYRATPIEPMGIIRRRHFTCRGRTIVRIDDELLDRPPEGDHGLVLVGEAALLSALEHSRTGRMRDIVATIQREQDAVIRAPLEGALVVQGGPGTGKTAVALHRAAYLLYAHRRRLERRGVLVVGPNPIFLRYIEQVLPSLGETATLATAAELVPGVEAADAEPLDAARLKGDVRMAEVIARAIDRLARPLAEPAKIPYEGRGVTVTVRASAEIVRRSRTAFRGTHNQQRQDVRGFLLQHLWSRWRRTKPDDVEVLGEEEARRHFESAVASSGAFRDLLDRIWPRVRADELVASLLASPQLLAEAAEGVLSSGEQLLLLRDRSARWTEADVALVDEAQTHLGPLEPQRARRRPRPAVGEEERWEVERMLDDLGAVDATIAAQRELFAERYLDRRRELDEDDRAKEQKLVRSRFGHVIVDEAQGLSPMQWRMVARRCPSGSMTILGDLGQAGAWTPASWEEALAAAGARDVRTTELTINYRTPAEIMDVAAGVLRSVAPEIRPPRSVRHAGEGPLVLRVEAGAVARAASDAATAERERTQDGKVGVVGPVGMLEEIARRVGTTLARGGEILDEPVAVLDVEHARGLEFDAVVVCEPSAIVAESAGGARALYVALTRPTRRLVVVASGPLPGGFPTP